MDDLSPSDLKTILHSKRANLYYRDLPMDLTDASLVVLAESLGSGEILSTDQCDFHAYRWKSTYPFKNLLLTD